MSRPDPALQSHGDVLLELALLVNERRSVEEIFAAFAGRMLDAARFDYATLQLVVEDDPRLIRAGASFPAQLRPAQARQIFPREDLGIDEIGTLSGGAEYTAATAPGFPSVRKVVEAGFQRAWVIGLPDGPEPLGLFCAARHADEPFSPRELDFLRSATGLLTTAIRQQRDLAEAQAAAARARAANEVSVALSAGATPVEVFGRLPGLLAGALRFDYTSLIQYIGGRPRFVGELPEAVHEEDAAKYGDPVRLVLENGGLAETRSDRIGPLGEKLHAAGFVRMLDAAMAVDGEPLGMLTFGRCENTPYSPADREFVALITNIFAQATANQRRVERTSIAAARSKALNEMALLLNQGESIDAIFQRVLDLLSMAIEVDYVGFLEEGEAPGTMRMVGSRPEHLRPAGAYVPLDELRIDILGRLPGPVIQYPVDRNPEESVFKRVLHEQGMGRGVSILIQQDGRLIGFLTLARRNRDRYDEEEVAFLETLSAMLGQAIVNRQRLARIGDEAARARVLNDASLLINTGQAVEEIFQQILPILHRSLDFDYADVFEADLPTGHYRRVAHVPALEGHANVVREGRYLGIDDIKATGKSAITYRLDRVALESAGAAGLLEHGYTWCVVALAEVEGRTEGVFSLARRRDVRFSSEERDFLATLARMLGQAIVNRRRLEASEREAARARLLGEIGALLTNGEPPEAFFQHLVERMKATLDFIGLALMIEEERGDVRVAAAMTNILLKTGSTFPRGDFGERVLGELQGQNVVEGSLAEMGGKLAQLGIRAGRRRGAVSALRHEGEIKGYLVLTRIEDEPFGPEDRSFLELLGALLAQATANRARLEAERREAERSRLLNEIAVLLNNGDSTEVFFAHLTARLQAALPFDNMVLFMHESRNRMRVAASMTNNFFKVGSTLPIEVLGEGLRERIGDLGVLEGRTRELITGPAGEEIATGRERAALIPLRHEGVSIGYLALSRVEDIPFAAEDCAYLELVGILLTQAFANQREVEESRAEAIRNQLLSELSTLLRDGGPVEVHFDRLCEILLQAVGFDLLYLSMPDPATGGYRMSRSEDLYLDGEVVALEPEVIPDVRKRFGGVTQYRPSDVDGRRVPAAMARSGYQRAAAAVIPNPDGPDGIVTIGRHAAQPFSEREMEFIKLFAALLGQAAANHGKTYAREAEALRNRILSELALLLNDGQPVEVHFQRLRELLTQGVGFDYVSVVAREPTTENFRTLRSISLLDAEGREQPFDPSTLRFLVENDLRSSQFGREGVDNGAPGNIFSLGLEMVFCVLLSAGTGVEGALTVGRRTTTRFNREERAFLELVGSLLSYAIANERRIAMSAQEAEEQTIVARAAAAVASEEDTLAIAVAIRDASEAFVSRPFVNFGYLEGDRVVFPGRDEITTNLPIGPYMRRALVEGQSLVPAPSLTGGIQEVIEEAERRGLQQHVMSAARSGGEIIGMLVIGSRDPAYRFGERELRLARLITDIIGPGMAHVRAVERERRDAEDQRVLTELAAVCARESNPVAILNQMAVELRALIPRPVTVFGYRDGDEVVYPRADGVYIRLPVDQTFALADERGQIFTSEIPEGSDPSGAMRALGLRASCTTAIRSAGVTVGYLLVGSREPGFAFHRRERELLRSAAQIVGPAMENARAAIAAREEAEDQRVLAEIAAIAAREPDADAIMNALPAALAALVPGPVVLSGIIRDQTAVYRVSDPRLREMFGVAYVPVPFSVAGHEALQTGQSTGHTNDMEGQFRADVSGIHAFALTNYQTAGSVVGTLLVATTDPEYQFTERVLALLRRAAQVLGPAIEAARVQDEYNRQRELYSLILRSLTEGVVLLDSLGRAMFMNALGRKVLTALGAPAWVDTWEESVAVVPEEVRADFAAAFSEGQASQGRAVLEIEDTPVHLDYEFVPLDNPTFKVLLTLTDVTADVLREQEEARGRERMAQTSRLAALGELIGGVAHELNNPLTAILGFAEIIGLSEDARPFAEELGVIQKEALRARNIVRDLLFIARPGTSERSMVPVADIVAHIERLRRSHWVQMGIAADIRIEPDCVAWGNEHQLTQVILNLVTNAEQALAGSAAPRLVLSARREGDRARIVVADNGKGMDEETRARIFEPFFTTRQGIGTGLGLPLSYSIIQSHEGTITVETSPGAGAVFTVDLPLHEPGVAVHGPERPVARPSRLRMLVIDDEPSLRKVCQRLVESLGHQCDSAENTASALVLARSGDFDVVLCDYRLATETADQVLEGLETAAPHLIPRTILATGATTDLGVVRLVEKYGLQLMAKPYGVEELSRILNESAPRAG